MQNRRYAEEAVSRVVQCGIKVLCFDLDLTAVVAHSQGRLQRDRLHEYVAKASPDFVALVPLLVLKGVGVAIATHSDCNEYSGPIKRDSHILGCELAAAVLQGLFPSLCASEAQDGSSMIDDSVAAGDEADAQRQLGVFRVIGYNPRVRRGGELDCNKVKRYHMRALAQHFGCFPAEILFFDDLEGNVADCLSLGVRAVQVDAKHGFRISDLLLAVA
jgi:hypothetical protein